MNVVVGNTGNANVGPLAVALTGSSAFTVMNDTCSGTSLAPLSTCVVQISLSTTTAATPAGTISVTDPSGDSVAVPLAASVLAPGALSISPTSWDFGSVLQGAMSAPQNFVVTNTGMEETGTLSVTLMDFIVSKQPVFVLNDGCSGKTLAANGTCTLTVTFSPGPSGLLSATLGVSAAPGGALSAALSGTGLAPASLALSPTTYAFPTTTVGATPAPTQTFTLTNQGDVASSAVSAASLALGTDTAAGEISVTSDQCGGQPLGAGMSCSVTVAFNPATFGSKSATLSVGGDSATITGTGQDFETLSVTTSGNGSGTVTGAGISCPGTCTEQIARTTMSPVVTLTAAPNAGSIFTGWTGACSGTSTCVVTMDQAQSVNAEFDVPVSLTVNFHALSGLAATLTSMPSGISCSGADCTQLSTFVKGSTVTLTVTGVTSPPALIGWSNGCTGNTCSFTINAATTLNATVTQNNIVFVSSTAAAGNVGLSGFDSLCNTAAKNGGLPGTYVAFLQTATATAFSRLGTTARGWIRPDGLPFADTVASMAAYNTFYPPALNEMGATNTMYGGPMTGVPAGGDSGTANCNNWTSNSSSVYAWGGDSGGGSTLWVNEFENQCNNPLPVYCFGTDFNASVSVPATTGRYMFPSNPISLTSVAAGDAECQSEASAAGLPNPSSYLAVLSTTTAAAASRFNLNGPNWIRPDGVMLATSPTAFMNDTILASPSVMANGQTLSNGFVYVWTGGFSEFPSTAASQSCNDWSSTASNASGTASYAAGWYPSTISLGCSQTHGVICAEN